MKKAPATKSKRKSASDLRDEYQFDYLKAKPNRFASRVDKSRIIVALEPDVSKVFKTPEAVNGILRALINAMPPATRG